MRVQDSTCRDESPAQGSPPAMVEVRLASRCDECEHPVNECADCNEEGSPRDVIKGDPFGSESYVIVDG